VQLDIAICDVKLHNHLSIKELIPKKSRIKMNSKTTELILPEIFHVRKLQVMISDDLARLYQVPSFRLNEALKRNADRFPEDFCFQLTTDEVDRMRARGVTFTSATHGGRRTLPYAFTEHGAIMLANILRSPRAVQMSIYVVRAFIRMREEIAANLTILRRLSEIDKKLLEHDTVLREIVEALAPLVNARAIEEAEAAKPKRLIGFHQGGR